MAIAKAEIIARLQKEILEMQGFAPASAGTAMDVWVGPAGEAFPNRRFPLGSVHEFIADNPLQTAASSAFISAIVGQLMAKGGPCIWISTGRTVFPPALKAFGIDPARVIFVDLQNDSEVLWASEQALHCESVAGVVAEVGSLTLTQSRRLQLAVERSQVCGFIIRPQGKVLQATACTARWQIMPMISHPPNELPGIGHARWQVNLLKVRNGHSGTFTMEWSNKRFNTVNEQSSPEQQKRKAG